MNHLCGFFSAPSESGRVLDRTPGQCSDWNHHTLLGFSVAPLIGSPGRNLSKIVLSITLTSLNRGLNELLSIRFYQEPKSVLRWGRAEVPFMIPVGTFISKSVDSYFHCFALCLFSGQ